MDKHEKQILKIEKVQEEIKNVHVDDKLMF